MFDGDLAALEVYEDASEMLLQSEYCVLNVLKNAKLQDDFCKVDVSYLKMYEMQYPVVKHIDVSADQPGEFSCRVVKNDSTVCNRVFQTFKALKCHIRNSLDHTNTLADRSVAITNSCPWCASTFASLATARQHVITSLKIGVCTILHAYHPMPVIVPNEICCPFCKIELASIAHLASHVAPIINFRFHGSRTRRTSSSISGPAGQSEGCRGHREQQGSQRNPRLACQSIAIQFAAGAGSSGYSAGVPQAPCRLQYSEVLPECNQDVCYSCAGNARQRLNTAGSSSSSGHASGTCVQCGVRVHQGHVAGGSEERIGGDTQPACTQRMESSGRACEALQGTQAIWRQGSANRDQLRQCGAKSIPGSVGEDGHAIDQAAQGICRHGGDGSSRRSRTAPPGMDRPTKQQVIDTSLLTPAQVRLYTALATAPEEAVRKHAEMRGLSAYGTIQTIIQRILLSIR